MTMETRTATNGSQMLTVSIKRNARYASVSDGLISEPERGFPPSITDSSQYESVQSIEARCMRGELMLQKHPVYEFEDDIDVDAALDVEEPEYGELDHFDQAADELYEKLQSDIQNEKQKKQSDLPTGNKPESDKTEKSEPATLPVDKSGLV